jgi:hypothetical protein
MMVIWTPYGRRAAPDPPTLDDPALELPTSAPGALAAPQTPSVGRIIAAACIGNVVNHQRDRSRAVSDPMSMRGSLA